jgi:hypothetical protein
MNEKGNFSEVHSLTFNSSPTSGVGGAFDIFFYEEAERKAISVFSGAFDGQMDRAIRSSRFFPA